MPGLSSRRSEVWMRLVDRFLLEETQANPERAAVLKAIRPTTDADRLLRGLRSAQVAAIGVPGVGYYTIATVPLGESWKIIAFNAGRATGSFLMDTFLMTVDGIQLPVKSYTTGLSYIVYLPSDGAFELDAGDFFSFYCNSWTSIGLVEANYIYMKDDSY